MSIRLISSKRIYKGRLIDLTLDTLCVRKTHIFRETIHHPGSCVIIPQLEDGSIIFVRQFRYPAGKELLEIPAGGIEKDETPHQCAARELKEEVGYKAGFWKKLLDFYPCPGYSTEKLHLFLARNLKPVSIRKSDTDELIKTYIINFKDAVKLIKNGKIKDAKTIIGLMLLKEGYI